MKIGKNYLFHCIFCGSTWSNCSTDTRLLSPGQTLRVMDKCHYQNQYFNFICLHPCRLHLRHYITVLGGVRHHLLTDFPFAKFFSFTCISLLICISIFNLPFFSLSSHSAFRCGAVKIWQCVFLNDV